MTTPAVHPFITLLESIGPYIAAAQALTVRTLVLPEGSTWRAHPPTYSGSFHAPGVGLLFSVSLAKRAGHDIVNVEWGRRKYGHFNFRRLDQADAAWVVEDVFLKQINRVLQENAAAKVRADLERRLLQDAAEEMGFGMVMDHRSQLKVTPERNDDETIRYNGSIEFWSLSATQLREVLALLKTRVVDKKKGAALDVANEAKRQARLAAEQAGTAGA